MTQLSPETEETDSLESGKMKQESILVKISNRAKQIDSEYKKKIVGGEITDEDVKRELLSRHLATMEVIIERYGIIAADLQKLPKYLGIVVFSITIVGFSLLPLTRPEYFPLSTVVILSSLAYIVILSRSAGRVGS